MEAWKKELYENELYHHGVLGMKWGIRRYQNKDGSYTKEGLRRFRKAESEYEEKSSRLKKAKEDYKSGSISKEDYKKVKYEKKEAKKNLDKKYDQVKKDYLADQGKDLYQRGKTITENYAKVRAISAASTVASLASFVALQNSGKSVVINNMKVPLSMLAPTVIETGSAAVTAVVGAKSRREAKRLRAYYSHSRPKD